MAQPLSPQNVRRETVDWLKRTDRTVPEGNPFYIYTTTSLTFLVFRMLPDQGHVILSKRLAIDFRLVNIPFGSCKAYWSTYWPIELVKR